MKFLTLLCLITLISACSTMGIKDCQTANWKALGFKDGRKGNTLKFYKENRVEACQKHGLTANDKQYQEGRSDGLKMLCTYNNGVNYGEDGNDYEFVCPRKLEKDFLRGYELGKTRYELAEAERRQAEAEAEAAEAEQERQEAVEKAEREARE